MDGLSVGTLATLSAGLVTIGAAYGIARLAASALDGIARQPEAGKVLQQTMVIAAGLIEGIAFLCAIICLIALFR